MPFAASFFKVPIVASLSTRPQSPMNYELLHTINTFPIPIPFELLASMDEQPAGGGGYVGV